MRANLPMIRQVQVGCSKVARSHFGGRPEAWRARNFLAPPHFALRNSQNQRNATQCASEFRWKPFRHRARKSNKLACAQTNSRMLTSNSLVAQLFDASREKEREAPQSLATAPKPFMAATSASSERAQLRPARAQQVARAGGDEEVSSLASSSAPAPNGLRDRGDALSRSSFGGEERTSLLFCTCVDWRASQQRRARFCRLDWISGPFASRGRARGWLCQPGLLVVVVVVGSGVVAFVEMPPAAPIGCGCRWPTWLVLFCPSGASVALTRAVPFAQFWYCLYAKWPTCAPSKTFVGVI